MKKYFLLSICFALAFSTKPLFAGKNIQFGINPVILDLSCPAGTNVASSLKIENLSSEDGVFSFNLVGYQETAAPGINDLTPRPVAMLPPDSLVRHLNIQPSVVIPRHSAKEVSFTINAPATLKGTQYVGISVLSDPQAGTDTRDDSYTKKTGVAFKSSMNLIVKCHIQNTLSYSYTIDSLQLKQKQNAEPMSAKLKVHNTGNAEIKFNPILVLTDAQKKVVARLQAEKVYKIIPNGTETVSFKPSFKEVKNGSYTAIVIPSGHPEQNLKSIEIKTILK